MLGGLRKVSSLQRNIVIFSFEQIGRLLGRWRPRRNGTANGMAEHMKADSLRRRRLCPLSPDGRVRIVTYPGCMKEFAAEEQEHVIRVLVTADLK